MPIQSVSCPNCGKPASEYQPDKWQCLSCGRKFIYERPAEEQRIVHENRMEITGAGIIYQCPRCGLQFSKLTQPPNTCRHCGNQFCPTCFGIENPDKKKLGARSVNLCVACAKSLDMRLFVTKCLLVFAATISLALCFRVSNSNPTGHTPGRVTLPPAPSPKAAPFRAPPTKAAPFPASPTKAAPPAYTKLLAGMTVEQVNSLLGNEGDRVASTKTPKSERTAYKWTLEGNVTVSATFIYGSLQTWDVSGPNR